MSQLEPPTLSIVIPTRDRPTGVRRAVESALGQSRHDLEVIVVDDGSVERVSLPAHDRLRCVRLAASAGPAGARNAGLRAARGRWIAFLDDDDRLLADMAANGLNALEESKLPPPVAAILGIDVVDSAGRLLERRLPPTYPRGRHFSLEPLPVGRSWVTKNTLIADRELLLQLGGFDASLAACEWIDLFLRLNPVCSILGVDAIAYQLTRDGAARFSRRYRNRRRGFRQLVDKHRALFDAHPEGHADALLGEARMMLAAGALHVAARDIAAAIFRAPWHTIAAIASPARAMQVVRNTRSAG